MKMLEAIGALLTRSTDTTATPSTPTGILPPAPGTGGLTADAALTLDAVYRAVDVILTGVEQLSIDVWRGDQHLTGTDVPRVITSPFQDQDMADVVGETTSALALRGNAYWRLLRDRDRVVGIRVLPPDECVPVLDTATGIRTVQWAGREWDHTDVLHLRKLRVPGAAYGLGPIQAAATGLSGMRDLATWGDALVRGGGIPTGILSTDQRITTEQAAQAADEWNTRNSTGGGVAVLGNGLKYTATAIRPADLQFLESRAMNDRRIARLFGIPPHLMLTGVEGTAMTYQNVEQADLSLVRWTLMSYLRRIESALTKVLPRGQTARFNLDAILRADTATRMTTHATAIDAGIYTADEARAIEGLDPRTKETP